ncbi:putative adenosine receptor A2a-like [Apostichopus japonicus]|uniref:Putative adenosine receptor A2a-like n=1 Tax=Stichopus japonicus TaxID=307972 RepID=A0A2G8JJN1_STIJA|nr:putative adenosine receptor A2a-like [Apostichopus japonicus]
MDDLSNITEDDTREAVTLRVSVYGTIVYVAVYTAITLMCVFGNALLLVSYICFGDLREISKNYDMFGLTVTDFLTGLVAMPLSISNRLLISDFTCNARSRSHLFLPAYVFTSCAIALLLGRTVDRYIAVSRPFTYHVIMNSRKTIKIVILGYSFGTVFGTLPVWIFGGDPHQWMLELEQYDGPILKIHVPLLHS